MILTFYEKAEEESPPVKNKKWRLKMLEGSVINFSGKCVSKRREKSKSPRATETSRTVKYEKFSWIFISEISFTGDFY